MADSSDLDKKLGNKKRHLTWVDTIKAGFRPPEEQDQYLIDVANAKEEEEKRRKAIQAGKKGPNI